MMGAIAAAAYRHGSGAQLPDIAARQLLQLLPHADELHRLYRPARAGETLCYTLGSEPITGISLYLVSNGPGAITPPHEHPTWSATVGMHGTEDHRVYCRIDHASRTVREAGRSLIGRGDVLALTDNTIRSSLVVGNEPTFHLHLYGKPLSMLPAVRGCSFQVQQSA
jgi:predicted metal-dependent enzyme (double-stranded beta helix superfamily)